MSNPFVYEPRMPLRLGDSIFHCERPEGIPDAKPCPFCGCEDIEITNTHTPAYWAECTECGARIDSQYDETIPWEAEESYIASFRSACEAWNNRQVTP